MNRAPMNRAGIPVDPVAVRRPGIQAIFDRLKRINPGMPDNDVAALAKVAWHKATDK